MTADAFYVDLGARIRVARKALGITQEQLGKTFGLTRASIANWESGKQRPPLHVAVELAGVLGFEFPAVTPRPAAEALVLLTARYVKLDRDRLNACLDTIMQLAHDARFPPRDTNEPPHPEGDAGAPG